MVTAERRELMHEEEMRREELIKPIIQAYKERPLTPQLINRTWQTIWMAWGDINYRFDVPSCNRTVKELALLQKENRAVLLVPHKIYTKEGLVMLGKIFPRMQNSSVSEGTEIINDNSKAGCIDIEMDIDAPNRDTTEGELRERFSRQGRNGQLEADYIIGSQFSKLLTGKYFDEGWILSSRLLGSRDYYNSVVAGSFNVSGQLEVHSLNPSYHHRNLGGRSRGAKKV